MADAEFTTPTFRVVTPKPKMTIYFALLIIALVAILFACLFLYLEIRRFGGFGAVPQRIAVVEQTRDLIVSHRDHRGHRENNSVNSVISVANC